MAEPVLEGDDREPSAAGFTATAGDAPDFLETLGIPLLRGRDFTSEERERAGEGERVVIVNRSFADRYSGPVLGRRIFFAGDTVGAVVVGVVDNVRSLGLRDDEDRIQLYYPSAGAEDAYERFILRVAGSPEAVLGGARARLAELDPTLPMREATTGRDILREQTADARFLALLLAVLAGLSLAVAMAGVSGAVALRMNRRVREMAVRIALGADLQRVVVQAVVRGMVPVVAGAVLGLAAAVILTRYASAALYEASAFDAPAFAGGVAALLVLALASCWVPARRAARLQPAEVLAAE
jgi:putative ABC transport system permease protein